MTQAIGTSWMRQPPRRPDDDPAYNQLIEQMGLEDVKRMMCQKSHGSVEKCKNCEGFKTCRPGQRAMRLMAERERKVAENTAPVYVQAWKAEDRKKPEEKPEEKVSNNPTSIEREEFKKACMSGNAWHWLMETRGIGKEAAGELLSRMIKRYPGIAADFGGGRRIMQRPRVVRIEPITDVEPRVAQEPASEPKVEETAKEEVKAAETAVKPKNRRDELNAQLTAEARERCRAILATGNPVQALVKEGKTEQQARSRIARWKVNYPDLFEGIDPAIYKAKVGRKKKVVETPVEEPAAEPAEDEVSLIDFLNEFNVAEETEETTQEAQEGAWNDDPMIRQMHARVQELKAEKERLRAEIEKMEERIGCIDQQVEALELCIVRF